MENQKIINEEKGNDANHVLANVIDLKENAVTAYVKEIGIAIQTLLNQREHPTYYFNSSDGQTKRLQVIELLHKCAMDALDTL
jgi:hypothetical protein